MASPLAAEHLKNLKLFIDVCKKDSNLLHHPDLSFFKSYIESLGGVIPPKKSTGEKIQKEDLKEEKMETEMQEGEEAESEESEVELDYEGVIEPDNDPPQAMGYTEQEITEEDMNKSDERKRCAIQFYSEQKYEEAINAYTEAILLNPNSALLYAKRGQCYLQLKKPNACVRDCSRALEINPDNAAAYKFRGRAHRLLGNFLKSAEDLRNACKIDYDEQADEWLKEVTPNARKLEEHQRKYERKRLEKEVKVIRDRIRKMREEQQKKAAEMKDKKRDSDDEGIDGSQGDGMGESDKMNAFMNILKDPEVIQAFSDPEVAAAFRDICKNPDNAAKYKNNPKINSIFMRLSSKLKSKMPEGFGGGFPPFFGNPSGTPDAGPKMPPPNSDIDLD